MAQRSKIRLAPLAAAVVFVLSGCETAPDVRTNIDRGADFTQYKTFGFFSPLGTDRGGYQSVVSQNLKAATQRELEARGMRVDSNAPQLLVNFNAALTDKLRVTSAPPPMTMGAGVGRGYYGYRGGMYTAWPMYSDPTTVTEYKEGTLNIDVVDAARKQLVWEGVVTTNISAKEPENVEATINAAVAAAFAKYPLPAPTPAK